ncbi:TMV resistance protein N-like isoform X1 [Prosopis cineraria]|uniref:TMV resistance protein N-like isoform X1 n=1 Tax=Prosopis cineraria TaxID=364024 RepID=UPI00240F5EC1|nr:TMV resistance protein N-like isoform X1 [Prosopis cineraria]
MAQLALCSSINDKWDYDVFLSFHGEDTRLCFVSILRESLRQRGIRVFIDDEFIRTGEEITPALLKAIQESRIAIIVFSENYASSTFCLEELEKILECFKEEGRLIYPVSYYVDPSELRRPRGSYAKALAGLEKRFEDNIQKVQKWRLALFQAANLKGCHLKSKIANEQECITKIISEVSTKINHDLVDITRHPVGLMSRVKEVISLLELWSTEKTKMVGIWGAGGIGKSTIARALFNSIADNFEGVCFLSNVKKDSQMPNGLVHFQETLLLKLVMEKDLKLGDFHEGIPIIKHRLCQKKILLILDDVDRLKQLEALVRNCNWFGPGSRVVITRNKQLLVTHNVNKIYNVQELNDEESLQLLSWYAFKKENMKFDFLKVSNHAIQYCCGLPLAIEVIGSNLRGKGVNEWYCALDQYKRSQEGPILEPLRSSYDALGEIEKNIFLDLACFFKDEDLREVKGMLHCLHETQPDYIIEVLIDKALIKIEGDQVGMHGLIEDMGKMIVKQESPSEPGKRSRLWYYQDILHVLKRNTALNLQPGKRNFIFPGGKFPENLDNYVHINDTKVDISYEWLLLSTMKRGHLHICDLQSMIGKAKLSHVYKWNHVKVSIKRKTQDIKSESEIHFALHVYKLQSNSNTIRFTDPRTNDDCSSWQRVQKSQNCEELEDDVPYLDIDTRMANLYERAYPSRWIYDVFLSYGGDYGCSSFVSRLCNSMCAKRIRILPNDEFLTPSVEEFNAMEESRIAIIIISENYGSSTSCLNSLATILECFRKECRSVYTIFYNVEPSKLQYQTGNCEELFAMLEKKLKHSKQQVQQWRLALSEVVSRGRYYYFNRNPNLRNAKEDKFIQGFIYAISSSINAFPFRIRDDSVGLESRVQEIISLLDVGSNEEVKMVGICGIFGIGKSALARAVCNFIAHHFEDLWYFSPISEEYRTLGNFLYPLCLTEKARGNYSSLDNFLRIIRQPWFPQRKNLVILDGVEELDHL